MIRKMKLEIMQLRGGYFEKLLTYEGADEQEIAQKIERDENDLLQYMTTGEENGSKAFVFQGFMLKKENIQAAQFSEPDF